MPTRALSIPAWARQANASTLPFRDVVHALPIWNAAMETRAPWIIARTVDASDSRREWQDAANHQVTAVMHLNAP
jgi:hypothetical protein